MGESAVVRIRTPPVFLHVDGKSINRELTDGSKRSRAPRTRPRAAPSRNTSRSCSRTRVAALYYGFDTRTVVLASAATKWNRRSLGEYRRALGTMVVASAENRGPTAGAITFPGGLPQYHRGRQHRHRRPKALDGLANFSSRGPCPGGILKPHLVAPGGMKEECIFGQACSLLRVPMDVD